MDADGSHQHRIFAALTGASDPVWAPDGYRMLITDGDSLYVLDAKHGHPRRIVTLSASAAGERTEPFPEWSPDGTKVVFDQLDPNGHPEIWIANADGSRLQRLTRGRRALEAADPSWQPVRR
jgi:Tol biopolymer transport system component